jgi:hypothetical protein
MAVSERTASSQLPPNAAICETLVDALDSTRDTIVSTWPVQAHRSLIAAGAGGEEVSVVQLAGEADQLLRGVSQRLSTARKGCVGRGANAAFELLGPRGMEDESEEEPGEATVRLHRSLIEFAWSLVLPAIIDSLSAEEIALARCALVKATHESLGASPAWTSKGVRE